MTDKGKPPLIYVDLKKVPEPQVSRLRGPRRRRWQPWRIVVLNGHNFRPLFRSTERYTNRQDAIDAIWQAFSGDANVYLREAERGNVEVRRAFDGSRS